MTGTVIVRHVDLARLPGTAAGHCAALALTGPERRRAERIRCLRQRSQHLITRGILRLLLADMVNRPPDRLTFGRSATGKPFLRGHRDVQFNVAHTAGQAVIAITAGSPVGVDVERVTPLADLDLIAREAFPEPTWRALLALPGRQRTEAFFRCWVRAEALVKATGRGLAGLAELPCLPVAPAVNTLELTTGLRLRDLSPGGGFAAALAVDTPATTPVRLDVQHLP